MIPKVIHYCWFGRKPLPELALRCIDSWKKYLPNHSIKEWNEDNYDINKNQYIREAYAAKKYAFVSDYARFDILYHYGGIYFDTDVELVKNLQPIINKGAFAGCESEGLLNTGLGFGSEPNLVILKEILNSYNNECFIKKNGSFNTKTVVERVSKIFQKHGFTKTGEAQNVAEFTIYPAEYFCPKSFQSGRLTITENTYSIHHFDSSWYNSEEKNIMAFYRKMQQKYPFIIATILMYIYGLQLRLRKIGIKKTIIHYKNQISN